MPTPLVAGSDSARIVAVISARNEVGTIAEVVVATAKHAHEVVVMDGHSTDGTRESATAAGATVLIDSGRGKGAAIRQAIGFVNADILVFLDADGSHDPSDIPMLVQPLLERRAELCVGSRFSGGTDELSVTVAQLVRTVGNVAMNIAINFRYGVALTDTLNGYRAIRRDVALEVKLTENRHTIEQEMVMKVLAAGYVVTNTPTHEYSRQFGHSHIAVWREWPTFVRCVATNIFRAKRVRAIDRPVTAATGPLTWMNGVSSPTRDAHSAPSRADS